MNPSTESTGASAGRGPAGSGKKPKLAYAIATAGGVGYLGKAPGTLGSLVGVATIVICGLQLALAIRHGVAVYWFGGWRPRHGVALGISFAIDPFGAGLACFCAVLTLAAQVFSWRHFESVGHAFPVRVGGAQVEVITLHLGFEDDLVVPDRGRPGVR